MHMHVSVLVSIERCSRIPLVRSPALLFSLQQIISIAQPTLTLFPSKPVSNSERLRGWAKARDALNSVLTSAS